VVTCGVYKALAAAAATNERRPSLPMTYGNSKLSYTVYINRRPRADISPGNFHL